MSLIISSLYLLIYAFLAHYLFLLFYIFSCSLKLFLHLIQPLAVISLLISFPSWLFSFSELVDNKFYLFRLSYFLVQCVSKVFLEFLLHYLSYFSFGNSIHDVVVKHQWWVLYFLICSRISVSIFIPADVFIIRSLNIRFNICFTAFQIFLYLFFNSFSYFFFFHCFQYHLFCLFNSKCLLFFCFQPSKNSLSPFLKHPHLLPLRYHPCILPFLFILSDICSIIFNLFHLLFELETQHIVGRNIGPCLAVSIAVVFLVSPIRIFITFSKSLLILCNIF